MLDVDEDSQVFGLNYCEDGILLTELCKNSGDGYFSWTWFQFWKCKGGSSVEDVLLRIVD